MHVTAKNSADLDNATDLDDATDHNQIFNFG
jgi:hypothetical protein